MKRTLMLSLVAVAAAANAQTYNGGGGSIPDNNVAGVDSTITIGDNPLVVGSFIGVTIFGFTHTWCGDLSATLSKTGGPTVNLFVRPGRTAANNNNGTPFGSSRALGGDYTFADSASTTLWHATTVGTGTMPGGSYKPAGQYVSGSGGTAVLEAAQLSDFGGTGVNGDWVLHIDDRAGGDTGGFQGWSFTITSVPEPGTVLALGAGLALLAFRKRR